MISGTNKISQIVTGAHTGGVFSLCFTKDGNLLSGGGKDRKIVEWDASYAKTGRETEVNESYCVNSWLFLRG
jgi:microtubule-associated protein-like 1/2